MNRIAHIFITFAWLHRSDAGFTQISSDFQRMMSMQNTTFGMLTRSMTTSLSSELLKKINDYGCWCSFDSGHGTGRGRPMDRLDELCKTLSNGYDCAIMDAEDASSTCIPWEVEYTSSTGEIGTLAADCAAGNIDDCAQKACVVEGKFVKHLVSIILDGELDFDNSLKQGNGFERFEGCPVKAAGFGDERQECCGAYPERFPYHPQGGSRACCGSLTISQALSECCAGDIARPMGMC